MSLSATSKRKNPDGAYATRDYERRLTDGGRKIISLDLDTDLISKIDQMRGNRRRGLIIEDILRIGLSNAEAPV